jgi:hypothetical protein
MKTLIAGVLIVTSCAFAFAQPAQTVRLRGVIEKVDGATLTAKLVGDVEVKLTLTHGARIVAVVKASMADVKENTFLGSAAIPQPDGTQKALEVHIFPEAMRGTGEGHRPYRLPNSTMTNGTIAGATVVGTDGSTMIVKYKGGEQRIVVPPDTPIVRYDIGSTADLKSGVHFSVTAATKKSDGTFEASRINVGRDGAAPR